MPADNVVSDEVQTALDHKALTDLIREVEALKADRDKFLRWGVIVLGGAVVTLVTWIFNLLSAATRH